VTHSLTDAAKILIAATAIAGLPLLAWAQGNPGAEAARKRLEAEKSALDAKQKRSKELQADVTKIDAEMKKIGDRLVQTGKQMLQIEARQDTIRQKLAQLEAEEVGLRGELEERHGAIASLLGALQRMGRNPPPVMITRREDALTMVRSAMLLAHAFPELGEKAAELRQKLGQLTSVIKSSRDENEKLKEERARHAEARVRLAKLQDDKRQTGAQHQTELQSVGQEVARIAESVKEVGDLLSKLEKEFPTRTMGEDGKATAVLAPSDQRLAALKRIQPQVPFAQAKGMLQLPIQGLRVASFGDKTRYGGQSKGIGIRARYGGTVVSPCDGLVVYAGEFRAYGQLLIISPGDGYHVLIAGLSQIDVQLGQSVLMGEPVGVMSSPVGSPGAKDEGPVLTVEFQKDRRPIDPDPWWSQASRKG
jgi:murein hydrolase activator